MQLSRVGHRDRVVLVQEHCPKSGARQPRPIHLTVGRVKKDGDDHARGGANKQAKQKLERRHARSRALSLSSLKPDEKTRANDEHLAIGGPGTIPDNNKNMRPAYGYTLSES